MTRRFIGASRLRRQLRKFPLLMRHELAQAMHEGGKTLAEEIAARAPKDGGDLAEAVHFKVDADQLSVRVGYSKNKSGFKRKWKYGGFPSLFTEFGTVKSPAQPFIRPAWRAKLQAVVNRVNAARTAAVKRVTRS